MKLNVPPTLLTGFIAALLCAAVASPVLADDPPGRVGRLGYAEGSVSYFGIDTQSWVPAALNYPITTGNSFWTDADGRSELQFGAVELRMDHMTEVTVDELDDVATRIQVPQGVVNVHVRAVPIGGSVQVMTPSGPIALVQPGTYHIDAGTPNAYQPANQVQVTVFEGQLQINYARAVLEVQPGETALLSSNPPSYALQVANPTPFDNWALMLERREAAAAAPNVISPYMTGANDLGHYGQWVSVPNYGPVWYPATVAQDWAPYRYGHWAYVTPWGWTWVDDAPWGFAPFHYGRWAEIDGRWGWVPGTYTERPVYAPALVAFIGGAAWSILMAGGTHGAAVGWVPLAPHEVYHPYYHTSENYVRNINVAHVDKTTINNITINNYTNTTVASYANQRGATVVPSHSFTQGSAVHHAIINVTAQDLGHAPVTANVTHLAPTYLAHPTGNPVNGQNLQSHGHISEQASTPAITTAPGTHQTTAVVPLMGQNQQPREHSTVPVGGAPVAVAPVPHQTTAVVPTHEIRDNAIPVGRTKPEGGTPGAVVVTTPVHIAAPIQHAPLPAWSAAPHGEESKPVLTHAAPTVPVVQPVQIVHPQQATPMAPTPQGWQRVQASHPAAPKVPEVDPKKKVEEVPHKPNGE